MLTKVARNVIKQYQRESTEIAMSHWPKTLLIPSLTWQSYFQSKNYRWHSMISSKCVCVCVCVCVWLACLRNLRISIMYKVVYCNWPSNSWCFNGCLLFLSLDLCKFGKVLSVGQGKHSGSIAAKLANLEEWDTWHKIFKSNPDPRPRPWNHMETLNISDQWTFELHAHHINIKFEL